MDGYQWIGRSPAEVVRRGVAGALFPFTQEYTHWDDRRDKAIEGACTRWDQDRRRFQKKAYEEANHFWKGSKWRVPSAQERAALHCVPIGAVAPAFGTTGHNKEAERVANSAVGNGLHLPSVMLMVPLLLQAVPTAGHGVPPTPSCSNEQGLRKRVHGSVFDPARLAAVPGIMNPDDILADMRSMLHPVQAGGPHLP